MQSLADAVAVRLTRSALRTNTMVQAVQPGAGGWVVSAGMQSDFFDAVIIALPAPMASEMLCTANPELSGELAGIEYTSSITVALGFDGGVRKLLPPGFGFLAPRSEGKRLLAATFVHNKFPHRAPEDRALLRCFLAGRNAESIWGMGDEQIVSIALGELQQIVGLRVAPLFTRVYRWKSAMAQYSVGHLDRLERIERLVQQLPGLALAGNAYRGIGVPDCVRSGRDAAQRILG
jgi:protoporphyrinogen/coproporphyrinogen III oxidase